MIKKSKANFTVYGKNYDHINKTLPLRLSMALILRVQLDLIVLKTRFTVYSALFFLFVEKLILYCNLL